MTSVLMTRRYKYVGDELERKYDKICYALPLRFCTVNYLNWILFCIKPAQQGCGPLEEDASTTLTCGSSCASNETLTWYADIHTTTVTVATCQGDVCEVTPAYSNNFSISPNSSTLTINSVSRSDPFNMETRWTCQCDEGPNTNVYTVCQELQIYGQLVSSQPFGS